MAKCNQRVLQEALSHARLRQLLRYNPVSGVWRWRLNKARAYKAGDVAGGSPTKGYRQLRIDGRRYLSNRLAWFYMTGEWPPVQVDHKDTDTFNDSWANLRLATNQQNGRNQRKRPRNTTGWKGVSFDKKKRRFRAYIKVDYKQIWLGYHATKIQAWYAYRVAAQKHFGEFANDG